MNCVICNHNEASKILALTKGKPIAKQIKSTFKAYSDPGHAWVAVKRDLLKKLGILEKITPFSYQRGATVYLEEDQDLSTFVQAFTNQFGYKPTFSESHTVDNRRSPIRSYESFRRTPSEQTDSEIA